MQKEKKVKSYTRRTKSGKTVTVRAHTAKYDAAEEAKELAKKKGSGDELEMRKRKLAMEQLAGKKAADILEEKLKEKKYGADGELTVGEKSKEEKKSKKKSKDDKVSEKKVRPVGAGTNGPEPRAKKTTTKKTASTSSEPAFTQAEYKAWYHWDQENDPKNKSAMKVAKALRAQMGRAAYNRYFNEMSDNYSARGHISAYKKVGSLGGEESSTPKKNKSKKSETSTPESPAIPKSESALKKAGWTYVRTNRGKVGGGSKGYWVSPDRETMVFGGSDYRPGRGRSVTIESDKPKKPTKSVLALLKKTETRSTTPKSESGPKKSSTSDKYTPVRGKIDTTGLSPSDTNILRRIGGRIKKMAEEEPRRTSKKATSADHKYYFAVQDAFASLSSKARRLLVNKYPGLKDTFYSMNKNIAH